MLAARPSWSNRPSAITSSAAACRPRSFLRMPSRAKPTTRCKCSAHFDESFLLLERVHMYAHRTARRAMLGLLLASTVGAIALPALAQDAGYQAAIANPARTDEDRKADAKRKPAEFLAFAKVRPGMNVLDVSAGGGATSALLAAAVGPSGKVYAQSPNPRPSWTPAPRPCPTSSPCSRPSTIRCRPARRRWTW